jgi:hypothetical protein
MKFLPDLPSRRDRASCYYATVEDWISRVSRDDIWSLRDLGMTKFFRIAPHVEFIEVAGRTGLIGYQRPARFWAEPRPTVWKLVFDSSKAAAEADSHRAEGDLQRLDCDVISLIFSEFEMTNFRNALVGGMPEDEVRSLDK